MNFCHGCAFAHQAGQAQSRVSILSRTYKADTHEILGMHKLLILFKLHLVPLLGGFNYHCFHLQNCLPYQKSRGGGILCYLTDQNIPTYVNAASCILGSIMCLIWGIGVLSCIFLFLRQIVIKKMPTGGGRGQKLQKFVVDEWFHIGLQFKGCMIFQLCIFNHDIFNSVGVWGPGLVQG